MKKTQDFGIQVLIVIKRLAEKEKESYLITQTSLLFLTQTSERNEGKVFLFKFGKKIFDKITEAMQLQR